MVARVHAFIFATFAIAGKYRRPFLGYCVRCSLKFYKKKNFSVPRILANSVRDYSLSKENPAQKVNSRQKLIKNYYRSQRVVDISDVGNASFLYDNGRSRVIPIRR